MSDAILVVEGRRMMRLSGELASDIFRALLEEYQRLLREVLTELGGRDVEVDGDTVQATFPTARRAAFAAVAAQRAIAAHEWPHGRKLEASVGLDSGSTEGAVLRCEDLCDAAEGGQIFLTPAVRDLLEREDLGGSLVRDLGKVPLRRREDTVRAYQLVFTEHELSEH